MRAAPSWRTPTRGRYRVERALAAEFTDEERATLVGLLTRCAALLDSVRPDEAVRGHGTVGPRGMIAAPRGTGGGRGDAGIEGVADITGHHQAPKMGAATPLGTRPNATGANALQRWPR